MKIKSQILRSWALCVAMFAISGCASTVSLDYDSTAVFGNYASWSFAPTEDKAISLDGSRVRSAVEREMTRKAMRQVDSAEADLLVDWLIVDKERLERAGVSFGLGLGNGNFGWGLSAPAPIRKIEEGKLVLKMVDTDSNRVVWQAGSRRYLSENQSSEARRELIDEIVTDMFKQYPPGLK